jgi:8-amino-3,8-dideoxy-alpha-D-manno-octulosonate transaminase
VYNQSENLKPGETAMTQPYDPKAPAIRHPLPPMYPGGMRLDEEEEQAVLEVIRSKRLFRYYGPNPGPSQVEQFEQAFCQHMRAKYAVGVTSGTAALICGLAALGVGPDDEVIVPAYTWIATASAVVAAGAVPVMAEVDESLTLDPADLERVISPYTKAVIPVHMRGAPCQMDRIVEIARKHNLKVLEDAAQANGASFAGRKLGTWGDAGAFSLQFNKIITSGEGGVVITDQEAVWQRLVMFHDVVGGERNHIPEEEILPGINFRMPELLGAVARVQLRRLDTLLETMRRNKRVLKESMAETAQRTGVTFRRLNDPAGEAAIALVFFAPDAQAAKRIGAALEAEGGGAWILYSPEDVDYHVYPHWSPIMNQRAWSPGGGPWQNHPRKIVYTKEMCPRTLDLLSRAVHIDISPELTSENLEELADALNKALEAGV